MRSWRKEFERKLLSSPEEAAKLVKSGDIIQLAWAHADPHSLGLALGRRRHELRDVTIIQSVNMIGPYPWYQEPGWSESFRHRCGHLRDFERAAHDDKLLDFFPTSIGLFEKKAEAKK